MTCRLIASGRRCCELLANSGPSTSVRATSEQTQRAMQPIVRAFRCDPQRVSIGPSKRTQPGRCSPRVRPVFRNGRRAVELRVRPVAYPNRRPPEVMQSPTCAGVPQTIDMCINNRHRIHKKAGNSEAVIKDRRSSGRFCAFLVIRPSVAMSSSRLSGRPLASVALKWVQTNSSGFRSGA